MLIRSSNKCIDFGIGGNICRICFSAFTRILLQTYHHPYSFISEVSLKIVVTMKIVTFSSDLTQIDSVVVEDFDAVRSVVGDEDLLTVVDHHTIREF